MAITYDKIAYDQVELELKSVLATEFPNVYIGNTFSMKGSECIRIDLVSSTSIEQSTNYEQRLYALNLRYYFKSDTSQERINKAVKGKIDRLRKHLLDNQVNSSKGWAALIIEDIDYNVKDEENEEDDNLHISEFNITIQHHNTMQVTEFSNLSVLFDGGDEYLDVGNHASLTPSSAMTISAWIKVDWDNSPDYPRIVDKNSTSYRLAIDRSSVAKSIFFYINGQYAKSTANALNSDDWQHVVGVFDKSLHSSTKSIKIYVNGNEVTYGTQQSSGSDVTSVSDDLRIGSDITGDKYFAGNIDEVSLWNTALADDTIKAIYNSGKPNDLQIGSFTHLAKTHLQGYWRMGDGVLDSNPLIADQVNPTLGNEIVTNGTFNDNTTGWSITNWTHTNSRIEKDNASAGNPEYTVGSGTVVENAIYKVKYDLTKSAGNMLHAKVGNGSIVQCTAGLGQITYCIAGSDSTKAVFFDTHSTFRGTLDNISVKKVNGNPALMTNFDSAADIEEDTP